MRDLTTFLCMRTCCSSPGNSCTALVLSVVHLTLVMRSLCNLPSSPGWIEEYLAHAEAHIQVRKACCTKMSSYCEPLILVQGTMFLIPGKCRRHDFQRAPCHLVYATNCMCTVPDHSRQDMMLEHVLISYFLNFTLKGTEKSHFYPFKF